MEAEEKVDRGGEAEEAKEEKKEEDCRRTAPLPKEEEVTYSAVDEKLENKGEDKEEMGGDSRENCKGGAGSAAEGSACWL